MRLLHQGPRELRPGQAVDPNRVRTHLKNIRALRASMNTKISDARLKQHSIIAMKEQIDTELEEVRSMLKDAEKAPTPPVGATSHDTSAFYTFIYNLSVNSDHTRR